MKLRAKATGNGIGGLVLSFFNYITPGSSISVKEKTTEIEIFFEEVPVGLLQALTECEDFELEFKADSPEELDEEEKTGETEERKEEKAEEAEEAEKSKEAVKREEVKAEKFIEIEESKAEKTDSDITDNQTEMCKKFYAVSKKRQLPTKEQCYAVEALLKIANSSTTYVEFVEKTADFLEIKGEKKERFVELVTKVVAPYIMKEGKSITWSKIEVEVEHSCKKALKTTDRNFYNNAVEKNIKVVKLASFINILGSYLKFYVFEDKKDINLRSSNRKNTENIRATTITEKNENASVSKKLEERELVSASKNLEKNDKASVSETLEKNDKASVPEALEKNDKAPVSEALEQNNEVPLSESSKEDVPIDKKTTKMKFECMPNIPWFEEKLSELSSKEPAELKIRKIFQNMGISSQKAENQSIILSVANVAVLLDKIDYNSIFEKAKIETQDTVIARMIFSKFINEFVEQNGGTEKIRMIDFLEDLKSIVNS